MPGGDGASVLGTLDRAATLEEGQRVEARWDGGTVWELGKITAVHGDGYAVHYDDGDDEERVAERLIREPDLDES